jgi:hypothetical protein
MLPEAHVRLATMLLALLLPSSAVVAEEKWDIEILIAKATPVIREVLKQDANIVQGANMQIDSIREEVVASNDPYFKASPKFEPLREIRRKVGNRPYWRIGVGVRELAAQGGYIFYFSRECEYLGVYKYS